MQTRKRYEKASVTLNGAVPSMLRKAKTVLSCKQYRELCTAVNEAADYTTKKVEYYRSNFNRGNC